MRSQPLQVGRHLPSKKIEKICKASNRDRNGNQVFAKTHRRDMKLLGGDSPWLRRSGRMIDRLKVSVKI